MDRAPVQEADASPATLSPIAIPPVVRATPEELRRRKRRFDETMKLRVLIGPIDISANELIRIGREEARY